MTEPGDFLGFFSCFPCEFFAAQCSSLKSSSSHADSDEQLLQKGSVGKDFFFWNLEIPEGNPHPKNLGNQSEQSILPSVHQRGRHHQHHASHMTNSHDTHAHEFGWKESGGGHMENTKKLKNWCKQWAREKNPQQNYRVNKNRSKIKLASIYQKHWGGQ